MKPKKIQKLLPLILLLILTPFLIADMGPKPTAAFKIIYETTSPPQLTGYALFMCDKPNCDDAYMLEEAGPQRFECTQDNCTSMAYGYSEYMYITFDFADGTTLSSNIFTKRHFDAEYEIIVGPENLKVNESGGSNFGKLGGPLGWVIYGSIAAAVCGGIVTIAGIVLVIVLIVRNRQKKKASAE